MINATFTHQIKLKKIRRANILFTLLIASVIIGLCLTACQQNESSIATQTSVTPIGISYSERSDPDTPSANLYIELSDGMKKLLLQNVNGDNDRFFMDSQVSKDCKKVVFTAFEEKNGDNLISFEDATQIYIANTDGSDLTQIAPYSTSNGMASWSPDGSQIAYRSDETGNGEVWTANSDGSDAHQVTTSANWAGHVHWSPNGEFIAFYSVDEKGSYLTVVKPDGSGYKRISGDVGEISGIFITTDNRIVFNIDNLRYSVNPDGSELSEFDENIVIENREVCGWPEKNAYVD